MNTLSVEQLLKLWLLFKARMRDRIGKLLYYVFRTLEVETHTVVLEEGGVKLSLTVVDTPGMRLYPPL
jgi:hypothetical protein